VGINSIEFYKILEETMGKYKSALETREDLQIKFIQAWESIENGEIIKDPDKIQELAYILKELKISDPFYIFEPISK
jgi:hypothetical protein